MTFTHTPTLMCKDRTGTSFALKLKLDLRTQEGKELFKALKMKKGSTVVVHEPLRSGVVGGKQGFIECEANEIEVCFSSPASMKNFYRI